MASKVIFGLILCCVLCLNFVQPITESPVSFNAEMGISEAFNQLGDATFSTQLPDMSMKGVSAEKGREIVTQGFTKKPKGGKSRRISKHFVCTACHNIEREDSNLTQHDPSSRLTYTNQKGIPFLQGTTLYGLINRTSFYNGDYKKKYGDLVDGARNDIRAAIQLCSTECSQGRKMKPWEVESVLAYLQTIEIKLGDLDLNDEEIQLLGAAIGTGANQDQAIDLIKSKYEAFSPATFIDPPVDRKVNMEKANVANGKMIFDASCMHCHGDQRYSFFRLDNSQLTFKYLASNFEKFTDHSIFQVGRYGTSPKNGKRAYMPQYTKERMSEQQLMDLTAYISKMAGK